MKLIPTLSLFVSAALFTMLTACQSKTTEHPKVVDGISGATHQNEKVILPPENENYRVMGHLQGLMNYVVRYDNSFYRGGEPYAPDLALEAFDEVGIKTIISITPSEEERAFCETYGFKLVEIPFVNPGPTAKDFETYFQTLEEESGPVFVHCKGGSHRAGIFGAAYRMKVQNWSYEEAIIEYGRLGGDLKNDFAMLEQLKAFEKTNDVTNSKPSPNTDTANPYITRVN
jgi:protein tyrosine/serine phosphatase